MNILCQTLGPHQHDEQNDIVEASSITDTCHLPLTHHYPAGRSSYHVCSLISHSHTIILPVSLLTMYVHSSPTHTPLSCRSVFLPCMFTHLPLTHHYPAGRSSYHACSLISHSIVHYQLCFQVKHNNNGPCVQQSPDKKIKIDESINALWIMDY